jgi:2-dehydropantoate 2-reductase
MTRRYVVIGAGAIGGTLAVRLFHAGHDVAMVARGKSLDALRRRGLKLVIGKKSLRVDMPTFESPEDARISESDVVLLAVKAEDSLAALNTLRAATSDVVPVVCAQNGVWTEMTASRFFLHVYGMCVYMHAVHVEAGVVEVVSRSGLGATLVGRFPDGGDDFTARLADDLRGAGFDSRPDNDIMALKYAKLLFNVSSGFDALCGHAGLRSAVREELRHEARAVLAATGIDIGDAERKLSEVALAFGTPSSSSADAPLGSTWQSLQRRTGHVEADYLNGEIVALGRRRGVATPANWAVQRLSYEAARAARPPGDVPVRVVEAEIARCRARS